MKEEEKQAKQAERRRFKAYLGENADLNQVADDTGLSYMVLYNIRRERNFVSAEIHKKMAAAYPDYDVNYIMFGVHDVPASERPAELPTDSKALFRLQTELAKLQVENQYLQKALDEANSEKTRYWKMLELLQTKGLDFQMVSSQTTDELFALPIMLTEQPKRFSDFKLIGDKKPVAWNFPGQFSDIGAVQHYAISE